MTDFLEMIVVSKEPAVVLRDMVGVELHFERSRVLLAYYDLIPIIPYNHNI